MLGARALSFTTDAGNQYLQKLDAGEIDWANSVSSATFLSKGWGAKTAKNIISSSIHFKFNDVNNGTYGFSTSSVKEIGVEFGLRMGSELIPTPNSRYGAVPDKIIFDYIKKAGRAELKPLIMKKYDSLQK
jgi:hypothetical protein